jgi:hypothetical protein
LVFSHRKFMAPNWRLSRTTQLPLQLGIAPDPHGSGFGLLLGLTLELISGGPSARHSARFYPPSDPATG